MWGVIDLCPHWRTKVSSAWLLAARCLSRALRLPACPGGWATGCWIKARFQISGQTPFPRTAAACPQTYLGPTALRSAGSGRSCRAAGRSLPRSKGADLRVRTVKSCTLGRPPSSPACCSPERARRFSAQTHTMCSSKDTFCAPDSSWGA